MLSCCGCCCQNRNSRCCCHLYPSFGSIGRNPSRRERESRDRDRERERDAGFETPTLTDRTSCILASPLVRLPFKKLLKSLGKEVLLPNESIACSRQANASTHSRREESHMRTEQEICVHVCVSRHRDSRDRSAPEKSGSTIHHEETLLPSE